MLMGIGGTPEGIIAACALQVHGRCDPGQAVAPKDDAERQKAIDAGHDLDRVLHTDDLVSGDNVFFAATGVTDGDLLRGVRYRAGGANTQSIVMRSKSGTIRMIDSYHRLAKLRGLLLGRLHRRLDRRAADALSERRQPSPRNSPKQ